MKKIYKGSKIDTGATNTIINMVPGLSLEQQNISIYKQSEALIHIWIQVAKKDTVKKKPVQVWGWPCIILLREFEKIIQRKIQKKKEKKRKKSLHQIALWKRNQIS